MAILSKRGSFGARLAAVSSRVSPVLLLGAFVILPPRGVPQSPQGAVQPQPDSAELLLGQSVTRELHPGETHSYRLNLEAGQFLHLVIRKKGIEAAGALIAPDAQLVAIAHRPNGPLGTVAVSAILSSTGIYSFRIFCANKKGPAGSYEVTLTDLRPPRPEDSTRIAAERGFWNAMQLQAQAAGDSRRKALAKCQEILPLWRALNDPSEEAATLAMIGQLNGLLDNKQQALDSYNQALSLERAAKDDLAAAATLNSIGLVYDDLSDPHKALEFYEQALELSRATGDRHEQAAILGNMGLAYATLGEKQKALDYYNQALPLKQAWGDTAGEASTLNNIGSVYDDRGEKQTAREYFERALALDRAVGNRTGQAILLSNIGRNYDAIGEKQKALDYYSQALVLQQTLGDHSGQASTLLNLGGVYSALGELKKALDCFEQALSLKRAANDRSGEATALNNLGVLYEQLGELQKGLDYYGQALAIKRVVGNPSAEATTLTNIGQIYARLGDSQKALESYNQALPLRRTANDRDGEADTLNNIGATYDALGDKQKALDSLNQALLLARAVSDLGLEATILNNIGAALDGLGERQKALENYSRALLLERGLGDPLLQATTLGLLMQHWQEEKQPSLAVFFGKLAVNCYQQVRREVLTLAPSTQASFAISVEGTYRRLADLLVAEGRLFEAQQVLALFKQEEFQEFIRGEDTGGSTGTLTLTSTERSMDQHYRDTGNGTAAIWGVWNALNAKSTRTSDEEQRFQALSKQLEEAERTFETFLTQDLYEQLGKNTKADASVRELEQKTSDLQAVLHDLEPGTVALYTVVAPERLVIILVLPDARISREYPITPGELRGKVFALRRALLSPQSDPLPPAQELYKIVIGPVEKDLRDAGAKTLMWSLDDVLRYIPIAALHDGKHFIVENYRNEIFTLSSISKLKDQPHPSSWQALAMGVSKSYGDFSPLPTVPSELHSIVRPAQDASGGLMPGVLLLDDAFTKEALETNLRQGFPIVHVASHFSFQTSGDDFSFLLLGGKGDAGDRLTLSDIRTDINLRFWHTELLTLSACESALSGERNGRELDGLGEIAQQKGAKAVIATLWSVSDRSTGALMRKFYETWTAPPGITKAAALQQAQLALLHDQLKPSPDSAGGDSSKARSFAHPYYWAPFILIGNWR